MLMCRTHYKERVDEPKPLKEGVDVAVSSQSAEVSSVSGQ